MPERPYPYCMNCGEDLEDQPVVAEDGSLCCCDECAADHDGVIWDNQYLSHIPPDYVD